MDRTTVGVSISVAILILLASCSARQGTIIYHQPVPRTEEAARLKLKPVTQMITTGGDDLARSQDLQVFVGTVEGAGDTRNSSEQISRWIVQRSFGFSETATTRVVSPERFEALWRRLEATGLFELPLHEDGTPGQVPYLRIQSEGGRRTYVHPGNGEDADPARLRIWNDAVSVLRAFPDEP